MGWVWIMKPNHYGNMAQLSLFMSEADLERVVENVLAGGCVLVPDQNTEKPEAQEIRSLGAFREWRRRKRVRLFFVIASEWGSVPFEWGKFDKGGCSQYFIRQKTGGPTLDIFAPFPLETPDGKNMLPHGYIAYHTTFWNPLTERFEKPPKELKAMYKQIARRLSSEGEQLRGRARTYLIAKGAKVLMQAGCLLGPPFAAAINSDLQ